MIDWFVVVIVASVVAATCVGMVANQQDREDIAVGTVLFIVVVVGGYMLMKYYGGP